MPSFSNHSREEKCVRSTRFSCLVALLLAPIAALHPPVGAQAADPETLFVVQSTTNGIFRVDIDAASSAGPLNSDGGTLNALRDLVVRDRGDRIDLIVTHHIDSAAAELLLYPSLDAGDPVMNPVPGTNIAGGLVDPGGLSLGVGGTLFFVENPDGPGMPRVWRLLRAATPTGYGGMELIDGNPPSNRLADSQIVNFRAGPIFPGDLLVLSQEPPAMLRYRGAQPCADTQNCLLGERRPLPFPFPPGPLPTSFVFMPTGDFLIATDDGRIFRYRLDAGTVDVAPFAQGLFDGDARLVAGVQDDGGGVPTAFLFHTNPARGEITRFDAIDGTRIPMNPFPLQGAAGIGIGTSRAAPTRLGTDVRIQPRESVVATFDSVLQDGLSYMRVKVFDDPRGGAAQPLYLCDPSAPGCNAPPTSFFVPLGLPNVVPASVRPLPIVLTPPPPMLSAPLFAVGGPRSVPEAFMLVDIISTAGFADTAKLQALEELVLGPGIPHCDDAIFEEQPRFFHCPDEDDPPVVGGLACFDISTGCGSNFGRTFAFSNFLVARDTSSQQAAVVSKLMALLQVLDSQTLPANGGLAGRLDPLLRSDLETTANSALADVGGANFQAAIADLETFVQKVRESAQLIDNNTPSPRNASGELLVRAISAIFLACGGTDCSTSVDNHAEDIGQIFVDGFESGDVDAWTQQVP